MYSKIYNPKTNRKVSIYSKTGRIILHKYLRQIGGEQNYFEIVSHEECGLNEKGNCHAKEKDDHCIQVKIKKHGNKLCKPINSLSPPVIPLKSTSIATPVKIAPIKSAPVEIAPVKIAPVKVSPVKIAPVKVAPVKIAPVKVAPIKTTSSIVPLNPSTQKPLIIKENRVSAADYFKNHNGKYGDICEPRNNGDLRCLVPFRNSAKWAEPSQNSSTLAYKYCNLPPWEKKCKF